MSKCGVFSGPYFAALKLTHKITFIFCGLPQTPKLEGFAAIANKPLAIVTKLSILDVCGNPGYAPVRGRLTLKMVTFIRLTVSSC